MHRQLADDTPDRKGVSVVSIEATATVDVHRDRRHLSAHDTDRLDSDAMLVRKSRRQQRPGFNRKAHAFFFLEYPFLQDALQEQPRVGDLELRAGLDAKLSSQLSTTLGVVIVFSWRVRSRLKEPSSISTSLGSATAASVETNGR